MLTYSSLNDENVHLVATLERDCFGKDAWSENLLRGEIGQEDKHYVVLKEDDEVIGYGGFCKILDEGDIMNIAVRTDKRRCGYASKILDWFFEQADLVGIKSFTLEVRVSNLAARNLYEKKGFSFSGIRKKYYSDGEDCCIYWKYM
ncbi:MAG: ribosomal protein S18-alanine N-acetyltransferase [Clostridia bacterium]|nr:ribosomal protein S18-alanine N-acetyltransferase [Clostridia bacterium]